MWAPLLGVLLVYAVAGQPEYSFNFMQKYSIEDIATKPAVQDAFINDVMTWEGRFATDMLGINYASGLVYDGKYSYSF